MDVVRVAILLVGHLRSAPRLVLEENLKFAQSVFGVSADSVSAYISTYNVRGNFASNVKNYSDVGTSWIDDVSDTGVLEDLKWLEDHKRVVLLDKESYADTQMMVTRVVEGLVAKSGRHVEGAGLLASGVAQARKLVRLWELADLANSNFDIVMKSRPDAIAKFNQRSRRNLRPREREILAVGEHRYVTEVSSNRVWGGLTLSNRRPFMNDIIYWATKTTFQSWVRLLKVEHSQPRQIGPNTDLVPLQFATPNTRGRAASWAMPELMLGELARNANLRIKTINGFIERRGLEDA